MDRNFLYSVITLLAVAIGIVYLQKTDSNFLNKFFNNQQPEGWMKEDPGWDRNQDFPQAEPPKAEPKPEPPNLDLSPEINPPQNPPQNPPPRRNFPRGPGGRV